MGGDDELDPEAADGAIQGVGRHSAREQAWQCFFNRRRLRARARVTLVGAAPAHAVVLLGDVGQVQEMREAARDGQRRLDRHGAQLAGERLEAIRRGYPRPLGERAHALDALEERLAFLPAQRLAQQFAEQAHVVSQGAVRVVRVFRRAHAGHGHS